MDKPIPPSIPLIRACSRYAFRSGEWARITSVLCVGSPPRVCFEVEFLDGTVDQWPIEDTGYKYEFNPSICGEGGRTTE